MWKPCGSLIDCRCFLTASALGPVCGIVGMLGVAPVVLNAPSLSRLVGGVWANAAVDVSAAVDNAINRCLRMAIPPVTSELSCAPIRDQLRTSLSGFKQRLPGATAWRAVR